MSFLHSHSTECMKSELDLFSLPPTQTAIENSHWVPYNPVSSLSDDGPVQFVVPGHGDEYIDLAHTMLSVRLQIPPVRNVTDAELTADANNFGPVNNLLHSLFNQVDVSFNQKTVSTCGNTYAYRSYIETLLNYGSDAKESHLTSALWYNDTSGQMEAQRCTPNEANPVHKNNGLQSRLEYCKNNKTVDMIGHLHCDVFNQDKFLLNGVEMTLRLVRSKNDFCLMQPQAGALSRKIVIKDISLLVRRVKINPNLLIAHAKTLSHSTAKYPITRVEVKTFTLHRGILGDTLDNVILGQLPKRIILGFVDNRAYNGNKQLNPFNFQHFNVNYLSLYVDGVQIPGKPLQPNYTDGTFITSYHTLYSGSGIHFSNEGNVIKRDEYPNGYCLYAFDLTPDLSAHCASHWNLVKQGCVRIEVNFAEALGQTVNCILYAEFDNVLEIDSSRQVAVDFTG